MKKTYVKPMVIVERYQLGDVIASGACSEAAKNQTQTTNILTSLSSLFNNGTSVMSTTSAFSSSTLAGASTQSSEKKASGSSASKSKASSSSAEKATYSLNLTTGVNTTATTLSSDPLLSW